jgi:PKD repeat protein
MSLTVRVKNTGIDDLAINSISIAGNNAGEFIQTNNCTAVAASRICMINVTFASIFLGQKTASLNISSNDPDIPVMNVPLSAIVGNVLTVNKTGTGTGLITSNPPNISCGSNCTEWFAQNAQITLTAVPDTNRIIFSGWSGGGCSGTGACTVTLNADTAVTAQFNYLPTADFVASRTTGTIPDVTVNFTDNSSHATSWTWDFGDGTSYTTNTKENPSHAYQAIGTFDVTLTVTNPFGTDTKTIAGYINTQPCSNLPVRIKERTAGGQPTYYSSLNAAYRAALDGDIIQSLAVNFMEDLDADRDIVVTIDGGYQCDYVTQIDSSTLQGMLTTSAGTVTIDDFEIVLSNVEDVYNIGATATTGGSISPTGTWTLSRGSSQIYTITPNANYFIFDVFVDGASVGPINTYTFGSVMANHTIEAVFATNYTITATAGLNGSISPSGATNVVSHFSQMFVIIPATGYYVTDVLVDGVSVGAVNAYAFTDVTADHSISASFGIYVLTVVTTGISTGTITSNPTGINCGAACTSEYSPGSTVILTASPSPGAIFDGWSGGGCSGTATTCTVLLNAGTTVMATFTMSSASVAGALYHTLQDAYGAAPDGATILVRDMPPPQSLNANLPKTITLVGGYNTDYSSGAGTTTLQGMIDISSGKLTINNFILVR